ncbi:MAG: SulP family inorganic anion transporter [Flavobacteriales bacterium]|nr:SulP family inorganic anion transporter [Flavobacteriales bacterium]
MNLMNIPNAYKHDVLSGFWVFLITLPLSLGISIASGFPPVAGLITSVIGGMLVGFIGGSQLTIKGPAAGLIVIALGAVHELGKGDMVLGYQLALATIIFAGILQVVFGILKLGVLSDFFPSSAVHGMLAAIGIIIASKQFYVLLGVEPQKNDTLSMLAEIPYSIFQLNPKITLIGLLSLFMLFTLPLIKNKIIKRIPPPLWVLIVILPLGKILNLQEEHTYTLLNNQYFIGPHYLVDLPDSLFSSVTFPVFSQILSMVSIKYIIMFSLVGSIESLLSTKAIDYLDPYKRKSNMNRDLTAIGVGNILSGLIGGLPMISEIIRSSANINYAAKTRWSNFFHGFFLLVFVSFFPTLLQNIPLAALAAMLVYTGYRLASPHEFSRMYRIGWDQFLVFIIAFFVTISTDLLVGILAGIIIQWVVNLYFGLSIKHTFHCKYSIIYNDHEVIVQFFSSAVFSNYIQLKKVLDKLPRNKTIIIDFAKASLIDHTVMENLNHYSRDYQQEGGMFIIQGIDSHKKLSSHELATRTKKITV